MIRHYLKGRSIEGFAYGQRVTRLDQVNEGDILIGDSHQFGSTNLYKVLPWPDSPGEKMYVSYIAPDGSDDVTDGTREMCVWAQELRGTTVTYYKAVRLLDKDELVIPLPNGSTLRCGPGTPMFGGYVRILDSRDQEVVYWDANEWAEDPECVMGAIFGAAVHHRDLILKRIVEKDPDNLFLMNASELREGDRVDLESCPFLCFHPSAEFELAEITGVKRETLDCVAVDYEGIDQVGYSLDTTLVVYRRNIFQSKGVCESDDCELPHCRLCGRHLLEHCSPLICDTCLKIAEGAVLAPADEAAWNAAVRTS